MPAPKTTDKNAAYMAARSKRPKAHYVAQALDQVLKRGKKPAREPWSPENQ